MDNYFDSLVRNIMQSGMYGGRPNANMLASMDASQMEDARLRGMMGSSRKRQEGERAGEYAMAKYPGLDFDIWSMEHGFTPWHGTFENKQQKQDREQKSRMWAQRQRQMLDTIPGPWGYR